MIYLIRRENLNNKHLGFIVEGKNVLQSCFNNKYAIPIITESPAFGSTINEVRGLYDHP